MQKINNKSHKAERLGNLTAALAFSAGRVPVSEEEVYNFPNSMKMGSFRKAVVATFDNGDMLACLSVYEWPCCEASGGDGEVNTEFYSITKR